MNKYEKWYKNIIEISQSRTIDGYFERHHIIPESLGGSNAPANLTNLTAREHFVCHWLLIKIYPAGEDHWKMLNALRMMRAENSKQKRYTTKITSRVYSKLKQEYAILQSERVKGENNPNFEKYWTEEQKNSHSKKIKGRVQPLNEKIRQISAMTGRKRKPFSEDWIKKLSDAKKGINNNMYGKKHTEESKAKQREKATGRTQTEETIKKKADAIRGSKREKKLCSHCQQSVAVNGYARWHGDNCKSAK
jgi:hypothetical protein